MPVDALDLQQQALPQVARADAGRVERLHHMQRRFDVLRLVLAHGGDLVQRGGKVAVFVQIADDRFGGVAHLFRDQADTQLRAQVVAQGLTGAERKVSNDGFSTDSEAGLL